MALTLTTHDTRFDDPDDGTIAKVLASLDGSHTTLVTLERSEVAYLQAEGSAASGFSLEHQDGGLDHRYKSRGDSLPPGRIVEIFQAYARGDAAWRRGLDWEPVPHVEPYIPWFSTWWGYVLLLFAVAGLIWWWRG